MKIGIMSDTHDNVVNYDKAIEQLKKKKTEALIHCGDLSAPIILKKMIGLDFPVHLVPGNTNDPYTTVRMSMESKNVKFYNPFAEVELGGLKIAIIHFPELAEGLAHTGKYDFVFHGHTHEKRDNKIGNTRLINPGEILGFKGTPTYAVLDTETKEVEFFEIE